MGETYIQTSINHTYNKTLYFTQLMKVKVDRCAENKTKTHNAFWWRERNNGLLYFWPPCIDYLHRCNRSHSAMIWWCYTSNTNSQSRCTVNGCRVCGELQWSIQRSYSAYVSYANMSGDIHSSYTCPSCAAGAGLKPCRLSPLIAACFHSARHDTTPW